MNRPLSIWGAEKLMEKYTRTCFDVDILYENIKNMFVCLFFLVLPAINFTYLHYIITNEGLKK